MSKPIIITVCDKCGREDEQDLYVADPSKYWMPKGWCVHDTEDGEGPEPYKILVLCDVCEGKFQLSIRNFKP